MAAGITSVKDERALERVGNLASGFDAKDVYERESKARLRIEPVTMSRHRTPEPLKLRGPNIEIVRPADDCLDATTLVATELDFDERVHIVRACGVEFTLRRVSLDVSFDDRVDLLRAFVTSPIVARALDRRGEWANQTVVPYDYKDAGQTIPRVGLTIGGVDVDRGGRLRFISTLTAQHAADIVVNTEAWINALYVNESAVAIGTGNRRSICLKHLPDQEVTSDPNSETHELIMRKRPKHDFIVQAGRVEALAVSWVGSLRQLPGHDAPEKSVMPALHAFHARQFPQHLKQQFTPSQVATFEPADRMVKSFLSGISPSSAANLATQLYSFFSSGVGQRIGLERSSDAYVNLHALVVFACIVPRGLWDVPTMATFIAGCSSAFETPGITFNDAVNIVTGNGRADRSPLAAFLTDVQQPRYEGMNTTYPGVARRIMMLGETTGYNVDVNAMSFVDAEADRVTQNIRSASRIVLRSSQRFEADGAPRGRLLISLQPVLDAITACMWGCHAASRTHTALQPMPGADEGVSTIRVPAGDAASAGYFTLGELDKVRSSPRVVNEVEEDFTHVLDADVNLLNDARHIGIIMRAMRACSAMPVGCAVALADAIIPTSTQQCQYVADLWRYSNEEQLYPPREIVTDYLVSCYAVAGPLWDALNPRVRDARVHAAYLTVDSKAPLPGRTDYEVSVPHYSVVPRGPSYPSTVFYPRFKYRTVKHEYQSGEDSAAPDTCVEVMDRWLPPSGDLTLTVLSPHASELPVATPCARSPMIHEWPLRPTAPCPNVVALSRRVITLAHIVTSYRAVGINRQEPQTNNYNGINPIALYIRGKCLLHDDGAMFHGRVGDQIIPGQADIAMTSFPAVRELLETCPMLAARYYAGMVAPSMRSLVGVARYDNRDWPAIRASGMFEPRSLVALLKFVCAVSFERVDMPEDVGDHTDLFKYNGAYHFITSCAQFEVIDHIIDAYHREGGLNTWELARARVDWNDIVAAFASLGCFTPILVELRRYLDATPRARAKLALKAMQTGCWGVARNANTTLVSDPLAGATNIPVGLSLTFVANPTLKPQPPAFATDLRRYTYADTQQTCPMTVLNDVAGLAVGTGALYVDRITKDYKIALALDSGSRHTIIRSRVISYQ